MVARAWLSSPTRHWYRSSNGRLIPPMPFMAALNLVSTSGAAAPPRCVTATLRRR